MPDKQLTLSPTLSPREREFSPGALKIERIVRPTLSPREKEFSPLSLGEKGWG